MLYKLGLLNRPELNNVYHSFYNLFLGRIQGVKFLGVSENTCKIAREVVGGPRGPIVIILKVIQCKVD